MMCCRSQILFIFFLHNLPFSAFPPSLGASFQPPSVINLINHHEEDS